MTRRPVMTGSLREDAKDKLRRWPAFFQFDRQCGLIGRMLLYEALFDNESGTGVGRSRFC